MASSRSRKLGTGEIVPVDYSYNDTLIAGRYQNIAEQETTKALAHRLAAAPQFQQADDKCSISDNHPSCLTKFKHFVGEKLCTNADVCFGGGDWIFLALLGVLMAMTSFGMDDAISKLNHRRLELFRAVQPNHVMVQYLVWISFPLVLVTLSSGLCHYFAPQAIGSGLPEMKTILRGVVLKEYLTFRTLLVKTLALLLCLGCGMPVGKEGPFVHISSILATLLSKVVTSFRSINENESRKTEMLAAACAVGVACTFGTPIGGVLFSIEVTSVYFAVRNYWRGFFAATCSAIVFRMTSVWFQYEASPMAFSQTRFSTSMPFEPEELIVHALIGILCGFLGAFYVVTHRRIVLLLRNTKWIQRRLIFPALGALVISSVTFPQGLGQYILSTYSSKTVIADFFSNFSWMDSNLTAAEIEIVERWTPANGHFFITLTLYAVIQFFISALANTLPIPTGVFIPTFVIGGALGRIVGELLCLLFPTGIPIGEFRGKLVPGSYALVGAAAFTGSVTHTASTSLIVLELTGQIVYIIPVMVGVLLANAIAAYLQPSVFDSMIQVKHLPYLPSMLPTASKVHDILVEAFMIHDVKYICMDTTLEQAAHLLQTLPRVNAFPLIDSPDNMILIGSVPRIQVSAQIYARINKRVRRQEAKRRREIDADSRLLEQILHANQSRMVHERKPSDASSQERTGRFSVSKAPDIERVENGRKIGPDERSVNTTSHTNVSDQRTESGRFKVQSVLYNLITKLRPARHLHDAESSDDDDLDDAERREWEHRQLRDRLDFQRLQIDHAPFQLVEQTSLYKAHSLFSLLSLQRAYVTRHGKLVGVVALKELRRALEDRSLQLFQSDGESALSHHGNNFSQEGLIDTSLKPASGSNSPKSIIELQQRF